MRRAKFIGSILNSDLSIPINMKAFLSLKRVKKGTVKSGIYCVYNTKTSDYYIGSAIHTARRMMYHLYGMRTGIGGNILLRRHAIRYGIDSFEFLLLHEVEEASLLAAESFWVAQLNPFYNLTKVIYRRNSANGATRRLVDNHYKHGPNYRSTRKKIIQYSLNGDFIREWNSIMEATKELNYCSGLLSRAVKLNVPSKGFLWKAK
jgi:hypothetical protein